MMERPNHLYYGDNLGILRHRIADESVNLIPRVSRTRGFP